jgi:hypothetical protein
MCTSSILCFLLKKDHRKQYPSPNILPEINEEGEIILEPKIILETVIKQLITPYEALDIELLHF